MRHLRFDVLFVASLVEIPLFIHVEHGDRVNKRSNNWETTVETTGEKHVTECIPYPWESSHQADNKIVDMLVFSLFRGLRRRIREPEVLYMLWSGCLTNQT